MTKQELLILLDKKAYIELDLQFFAKDGPGGEKTEQATDKKLSDARKEGQVAKSKELGNAALLFALFVSLRAFAGTVGLGIFEAFTFFYSKIPEMTKLIDGNISTKDYQILLTTVIIMLIKIMAPFLIISVVLSFLADVIQVKWKPTSKPLQPKLSKLNPISGMKRLFGTDKLVELFKSIVKILILGYMGYLTLVDEAALIYKLYDLELGAAIRTIGEITIDMGLRMSFFYLVFALIDYGYQKWKFNEDMKMTKQEVKDEMKNSEGDPQIKGQQRRRMQEASRRRMMQSVPEADVVITNPTHFAVALKYDQDAGDTAPFVVAKGQDFVAAKIKEIAKENGVEIVENKPLARQLYANVELGQAIPPELYEDVALILAYVYRIGKDYETRKRA